MSRTAPPFKPSFDYSQPAFQSRSSMPPPEFYPRQQHQNCSHIITDSGPQCGLALLNQVSNSTDTKGRNGSSSSTESSSSIHTQPAIGNFGQGQGWIRPSSTASIWGRPEMTPYSTDFYPRGSKYGKSRASISTSATAPSDDYHLLSMADGLVEDFSNVNLEQETTDSDILFNPSLHSPPSKTVPNLDPSTLTSHQISALAAAFAAPTRSPQINQLVTQATRLAKGLARPPPNRGFRAKASDMIDRDESNTTVFVGGLSQGVTESILNDIFEPYGSIAYVKIPPGKGCGFVQFQSKQDAEHAIKQMQGFECLGCSLRTHWGRSQASDKPPAPGPISDQVTGQVISVCAALGVPKEHAELVMRVMAACTGSAQAEGCECE